jgi:DNA-binding PadR family transcriptional regulator
LRSRWSQVEGRRRRVYELTPKGARALAAHRRDWERFSQSVGALLEGT